ATDYIIKGQYARLVPAIRHALEVAKERAELKRLESQLRQAQKMEAIGQLAGGIAHDFNNLLTVISGYVDLALSRLPEGDLLARQLREVRDAGHRAASLTRQLLAFSRKQVISPRVLDLNFVVADTDKLLQRVIGENIALETALAQDLGCVRADPGQIEQVLMNLAVNARDAMPDGGKLTIETANVELDEGEAKRRFLPRSGPHVLLTVSDTGIGMDEGTQAHVFEPFFTTKGEGKGTGLGLATVYGVVKQSGGSVFVYSEPGHGSTFKIYLPRVDEPAEAPRGREKAPVVRGGSETILVVEDSEQVRGLACSVLRGHGYGVLEARLPEEALRILGTGGQKIGLMVTDVVMPEMSGRTLATKACKLCPDLRVLYMSGYTDNAIVHHGLLEPGIHFLQKPFSTDALARRVREILDEGRGQGGSPLADGRR
ncbi:MAG TPA: ATP-binding protein, partial [Longimicrobiales bacterium]